MMGNSDGWNDMNEGGYEDLAWVYGTYIKNRVRVRF